MHTLGMHTRAAARARGAANDVEFVPFSIEAGGAWGPAAKRFFNECLELADGGHNVDLYLVEREILLHVV